MLNIRILHDIVFLFTKYINIFALNKVNFLLTKKQNNMKDIDEYRLGNLVIFENESTKAKIVRVTQIEYVNNTIYSL